MKTILVITICLLAALITFTATTAEDLVTQMTDKTEEWDVRCAAEDALSSLAPEKVLPLLLPHIGKGMPSPIWNSGGRDHDKEAPVEWQIFYAVARSWNRQVDSLPRDSGGTLLVKLLGGAKVVKAQNRLLLDLTRRWVPEAEAPVAALLKDPKEDFTVRTSAALPLLLHGVEEYHNLLIGYAQTSSFAERKRWFDLLSHPGYKKRTGVDPRVVQMGFSLILEDRESSPDYVGSAYFLAIKTGDYIGQEFKPDQEESKYQGEYSLADSFFADTVENAIAWWMKNKTRMAKELPVTASNEQDTLHR